MLIRCFYRKLCTFELPKTLRVFWSFGAGGFENRDVKLKNKTEGDFVNFETYEGCVPNLPNK